MLGADGTVETITGTPIHPIWSVDRQEWVPLAELAEGETLQGLDGLAVVLSVTLSRVSQAVYNVEVHGEHVYQVGELGLVVHNAGEVCLGIDKGLDAFTAARKGINWKQLVPGAPHLWKSKFLEMLNDGKTLMAFNLDGVRVWEGVARATTKAARMTDWELLQIQRTRDAWSRITWIMNGKVVPNPFL